MIRIFFPLALISIALLVLTFVLGLQIDDPRIPDPAIQQGVSIHFVTALGTLCFATLVHALVLTYFMGTGRWLEETSTAYQLDQRLHQENQAIKYRVVPALVGAFLLLLATGAFGAAADPASPIQFTGWFGLSPATLHQLVAVLALLANVAVYYAEYLALFRNGEIIDAVLAEVRRIRLEKGLSV